MRFADVAGLQKIKDQLSAGVKNNKLSHSLLFVENNGKQINWGTPVSPNELGLENMLEVCLGLCNGSVTYDNPAHQ